LLQSSVVAAERVFSVLVLEIKTCTVVLDGDKDDTVDDFIEESVWTLKTERYVIGVQYY
jgi:hypothetical protein